MDKIGFGGGCHWCTEAIYQSLNGVERADQGWISSSAPHNSLSEGVLVSFDPNQIDLNTLISIHLYTHSCTSVHSMRKKYRSAVYTYSEEQGIEASNSIRSIQNEFDKPIITQVLPFNAFKINRESYLDYYYKNPNSPFCITHITPKLDLLMKNFSDVMNMEKLNDF